MFCPHFFSKQVYYFHSSSFYNIYSLGLGKKPIFSYLIFFYFFLRCALYVLILSKWRGQKWTRRKLWNMVHVTLIVKFYLHTIPIWQNPGSEAIIGPGPLNNVSSASIRLWNFSSVCEYLVYKSYSSYLSKTKSCDKLNLKYIYQWRIPFINSCNWLPLILIPGLYFGEYLLRFTHT